MGETDVDVKDALQATGQPSDNVAGTTSTEPTTFTKEQVDKQLSDALADQGRKHKTELKDAVATERDANLTAFKETQERISVLNKELKELSEGDGDDARIAKLIVNKQAELDNLQAEREALKQLKEAHETEWESKQERIKRAEETNFEIDLWDLAEQYQDGNHEILKKACEVARVGDIEGAKKLADALWTHKSSGTQSLINGNPDSGGTSGGDSSYKAIRDAWQKNPTDPRAKEAYLEARRQRGL